MITIAVFVFGLIFYFLRSKVISGIDGIIKKTGPSLFFFLVVLLLGFFSSAITAIIASLILVEIVSALKMDKEAETRLVIIACFAIGIGAVLTPIGEPLSTIAVGKLKDEPHNARFWFLFQHLIKYVAPVVFILALGAAFLHGHKVKNGESLKEDKPEPVSGVLIRALKVYVFVMALVLLGSGFRPVIDAYIARLPAWALYWINTVSAILDNATLTAAELSPQMDLEHIKAVLLGLLFAGGMLIPGNIPNIIAAGKLHITSRDWAKLGVPLGFAIMLVYFGLIFGLKW
jgi:predicted cation transporter